ncbi:MAG: AraC-like DNA-binding protein [Alphaproteobacteria bacterium]|jgi:AraC-like DNA-binding protein
MDAAVVKGCTMRILLGLAPVNWLAENVFRANQLSEASTALNNGMLVNQSSLFLFDISIVLISFTAIMGIVLGVFGNMIFAKFRQQSKFLNPFFIPIYSRSKPCDSRENWSGQTQEVAKRITKVLTPSSSHQFEISHYHIRKSWVCDPLNIIAEQLTLLATHPVNIDFTSHISDAEKPTIRVCPIWFSGAVNELLNNALKHNSSKINLAISVNTYIEDKEFIVTIVDNGAGISENITNKLVSAAGPASPIIDTVYSQLDGPTNLFSIGSLLRQMQGTLDVSSARQFLTKITMKLPLIEMPVPSSNNIKTDEAANIDDSKKRNLPSLVLNEIKNNPEELLVYKPDWLLNVEDCIADYHVSLGAVNNVNDQKSIKFVDKFRRLLLEHYTEEDFNRPLAAKMMLLTDKTLTRRLNRHYQLGFVEILRKFRLHQAKELLLYGEKVTNVAFDTGFSSPSYFAYCFKAEFGVSPSFMAKQMVTLRG